MNSFLTILKISTVLIGIIGTAVTLYALQYAEIINIPFLNRKKSKTNSSGNKTAHYKKNTKHKKTSNMKDILKIRDIRNGILHLEDETYAVIIKLGSIDVRLLSEEEQNTIEDILIKTVIALPNPFKFIVLTSSVDTSNIIESIYSSTMENELPLQLKSLAGETINYLENMMYNKSIYVRENYIVIFSSEKDVEKAYGELNRLAEFVIAQMNGAKIKAERLTSEQEIDFIYRFLNNKNHKPSDSIKSGAFSLYVDVPYVYYYEGDENIGISEEQEK
ncbi:hypothetical protein SAMN04244560_00333 [Thermoanaerobacter thermohydrosulfuricus]|uniref:Uncharacterized protein n=1 Tax=Thermoanaerobacter thermohydrosulfuricus TaxID=1516 RepID=A0A1G7ITZ1_THETY|nr:hypothetical protein [Thermoanaerobacter thermohydrosulfuricus]SDF16170.1 hypothetical protein SAMN04244560_00333 [Thermoanaerobacter thermohydrosulfuricus]